MIVNPAYTANLTEQQRTWFYAEYREASKDEVVGVLLALFLGSFGIHRFYLGQTGAGVLYLVFSWTGIPAIVGFIECFFMPGRVRAYNAAQAQYILNGILSSSPQAPVNAGAAPPLPPPISPAMECSGCGSHVDKGAAFCPNCGAAIAQAS
jgi:TM2 domain-containing membrane protein YozV